MTKFGVILGVVALIGAGWLFWSVRGSVLGTPATGPLLELESSLPDNLLPDVQTSYTRNFQNILDRSWDKQMVAQLNTCKLVQQW